MGVNTEKQNR